MRTSHIPENNLTVLANAADLVDHILANIQDSAAGDYKSPGSRLIQSAASVATFNQLLEKRYVGLPTGQFAKSVTTGSRPTTSFQTIV